MHSWLVCLNCLLFFELLVIKSICASSYYHLWSLQKLKHYKSFLRVIFHYFSVLTDEHTWKEEGLFKSFIAYASFTMFDFPFEAYCALRFFISRKGNLNYFLKRYTLVHNIVCVTCNMVWQFSYLAQLWSMSMLGSSLPLYIMLIVAWVQEEYVVMKHLLNL